MSLSMCRLFSVLVAVSFLAAACGGGDDSPVAAPEIAEPTAAIVETPEPAATTTPAEAPDEPATETPDAGSAPTILSSLELPTIEFTMSSSGLGVRPLLEWAAVDGAAEYQLVVLDSDGEPYWAWVAAEPSVPFEGGEAGSEPGQLAILHEPMTVSVVAYDTAGAPIATSELFPLAP